LTKRDFDAVIRSGADLIIFFYQKNSPVCIIAESALREVDQLLGKNFELYCVDMDAEIEIKNACSVSKAPEFIAVRGMKIYKRKIGPLRSNEILDLLK